MEERRVMKQDDIYQLLPFGKTKTRQLIQSGALPVVKIGNDYITTYTIMENWIKKHIGEEIYYLF